jgi:hypothetical protein
MHAIQLKSRGRIGTVRFAVQAKKISNAWVDTGYYLVKVASRAVFERFFDFCGMYAVQVYAFGCGRPHQKFKCGFVFFGAS